MALDGLTLFCLKNELNKLIGGRIDKIYQPESDTVLIYIRNNRTNYKLLLSAEASNARIHLTTDNYENPTVPPAFCMALRKYLIGGRIHTITQNGFDRILNIQFETKTELEDITILTLTIEIMGKHSNIILVDSGEKILTCIKNVSQDMSKRPVLPGLKYELPPITTKLPPDKIPFDKFKELYHGSKNVEKFFIQNFEGISPLLSKELFFRASLNTDIDTASETVDSEVYIKKLYETFCEIIEQVISLNYIPSLLVDRKTGFYKDFSCVELTHLSGSCTIIKFANINDLLDEYFKVHVRQSEIKQLSSDLTRVINLNLDRCYKKLNIQKMGLEEAENRDKYKLYGELLTANMHMLKSGQKKAQVYNYYDNTTIEIPLDPSLSPSQNAQRYYKKYNKLKNAYFMLMEQIKQNEDEINYLESQLTNIEQASNESDLLDIKKELINEGYIKKHTKQKKEEYKSKPRHYKYEDFDIYVGKNNLQNDFLTLKFARADDVWLHTSKIHGSHVIIKAYGKQVPDKVLETAAKIAAYYSKARESSKVPVDYTLRKNVKKPNGAKPGMVIYDNYRTLYVNPDTCGLYEVNSSQ